MSLKLEAQLLHGQNAAPLSRMREALGLTVFQASFQRDVSLQDGTMVAFAVEQHVLHLREPLSISAFVIVENESLQTVDIISIQSPTMVGVARQVTTARFVRQQRGEFLLVGGNVETSYEGGSTEQIIHSILQRNAVDDVKSPMHRRDVSFFSQRKINLVYVHQPTVKNI